MKLKQAFLFLSVGLTLGSYADDANNNSAYIAALANGVDVPAMQTCINKIHQACTKYPTWEQKKHCEDQLIAQTGNLCLQTRAIIDKLGIVPNQVQAVGPVTLFTQFHSGDGQYSYHMIDSKGRLIDLAWDTPASLSKNSDWQKLLKKHPQAGLTGILTNAKPRFSMPEPIAQNIKQKDTTIDIIFQQAVRAPACMACDTVGTAEVAYRFSYPEGKFLDIELVHLHE